MNKNITLEVALRNQFRILKSEIDQAKSVIKSCNADLKSIERTALQLGVKLDEVSEADASVDVQKAVHSDSAKSKSS